MILLDKKKFNEDSENTMIFCAHISNVLKDVKGLEYLWKDVKGLEYLWKDVKGLEYLWKDVNGLEYLWKDVQGDKAIKYPQLVLLVEETRVPEENLPCRKSLTNFIT